MMDVRDFFLKLNDQLKCYEHQYVRQNEGRVYLGFQKFDFSNFTKDQKTFFVYYLSFFVAFDLLVFTYDKINYAIQKEKLQIPKFEYGLTNTFVYPNRIYDNYREPFEGKIFKTVFELGMDYLYSTTSEIQPLNVFLNALNDKDFKTGIFNHKLKNEIEAYQQKLVE